MSYIYLLYYNQYPPENYMNQAVRSYKTDKFGFENITSFDKFSFYQKERPFEEILHLMKPGEIYIGREEEIPKEYVKHQILYPDNTVAFSITYF